MLDGWPEVPHLLDSELGVGSRRSPRAAVVHRPRHLPEVCEIDGVRYRLDFLWPDCEVAGEADGRIKYLTGADLLAEKRREDDIRSLGLRVARWDWDEAE